MLLQLTPNVFHPTSYEKVFESLFKTPKPPNLRIKEDVPKCHTNTKNKTGF